LVQNTALVAASALLVDYVQTVAVSVVTGIARLTSAFPAIAMRLTTGRQPLSSRSQIYWEAESFPVCQVLVVPSCQRTRYLT
jgi:hypothetical protein